MSTSIAFNERTVKLDVDYTGVHKDNRIVSERHVLTSRSKIRSIAPRMGPFFASNLIIRDGENTDPSNTPLKRGYDYQIVELHQEATLKCGKEISSVILLLNNYKLSNTFDITYQALGGHYAYSDEPIANMYRTLVNDTRPVEWTNVNNKPIAYKPTLHRHLLEDIYGFEPVVDYLERIKNAITIGQTHILMSLITSLLTNFKNEELLKNIPSTKLVQYDALLYTLSKRKLLSRISVDIKEDVWYKGSMGHILINTIGYNSNATLYWEFYNPDGPVTLFGIKGGKFITNDSIITIPVYIPTDTDNSNTQHPIYVGVKLSPTSDDYIAVSYVIDIREATQASSWIGWLHKSLVAKPKSIRNMSYYDESEEHKLWHVHTNY